MTVAEDIDWQEIALCRQVGVGDEWFPEKGGSAREAKAICQRCDVRQQCLEYALANDERFGVWGGLSERERYNLKPRQPRQPAPGNLDPRPCAYCGSTFKPWSPRGKFCSKSCKTIHQRTRERQEAEPRVRPKLSEPNLVRNLIVMCRTCGADFTTSHPKTKYCSDECRRLAINAQMRKRYRDTIKGGGVTELYADERDEALAARYAMTETQWDASPHDHDGLGMTGDKGDARDE